MTASGADNADQAPQTAAPGARDKAAELMAAVRAVESGERSAAEFFAEPKPAPRPRRAAPAARPGVFPGGPGGGPGGPVAVPEGVTALLAEGGAPAALGEAVVETFGEGAEEVLRADPWELLAVPGVLPEQADGFARALLGPESGPGDERRGRALAVWLLERAALSGHTVLGSKALAEGLARYGVPDPDTAVGEAVDAGAVLAFEDAGEEGAGAGDAPAGGSGADGSAAGDEEEAGRPVRLLVGLERHALAEESLAEGLARLSGTFAPPGEEEAARWEEAAAR
ncbi:helix-hairpin-helix domain-containing protein, partial [Streptomyces nanhaiensis]|uniref:helix-hairpin-helix domain-containing protein n=1 Tax=Streptomyces nanhaiensis TaxID=679319 RepID=UPI00399D08A2